jgi:hypothetical protein
VSDPLTDFRGHGRTVTPPSMSILMCTVDCGVRVPVIGSADPEI